MQTCWHDRADELENDGELLGDAAPAVCHFASEDEGYYKTLKPRQIQMIAIGASAAFPWERARHPAGCFWRTGTTEYGQQRK